MKMFLLLTIWMVINLTINSCSDETAFKRTPEYVSDLCYGDVCNPETPGEEVCTVNPNAPECLSYCTLFPTDPACSQTSELDCLTNPFSEGCYLYCMENPYDPMCGDPCDINPTSIECAAYCIFMPTDPDCFSTIDCWDNPTHSACVDYCVSHPTDPVCEIVPEPVIASTSENFTQNVRNNKVDILWVIDNSGSMADEQERLGQNFDYFINRFINSNTNFQIGVVTTDVPNDNGLLKGNPKIIESDIMTNSEIVSAFNQNVRVGIEGASIERGLKSARIALDYASVSGTYNYGFLREDAFLAIIFVSDENDFSNEELSTFVNYFINFKGGGDFTNVYAIVDDQNYGCTGNALSGNPETLGDRYMHIAQETGGFTRSICTTNFASSLLNISKGILTLINRFELSQTPIQSSIAVTVNGTPISNDYNTGFIYDDSLKSIVFMGSYVPPEGSVINVSYNYYN